VSQHPWFAVLPIMVFGAMGALFVSFLPDPENWFLAGVAVCCIPWTLAIIVRDQLGLAAVALGGAAEEWTSRELRQFVRNEARAGRVWHVVDNVPMHGFDIDHVLIGPGGVIAVETKWSTDGWAKPWSLARVEDGSRSARTNARHVKGLLRREPHRLDIPVDSLLVLWPSRATDIPDLPDEVVLGATLKEFCMRLERDRLDSRIVTAAATAIATFVRERDDYELRRLGMGRLRRRRQGFRFDPLRK
jgi:hypothetical protein